MRILCLGDSMTYGDLVARDETWVSLVDRESPHDLINAGVNGASTDDMRRRLPRRLERDQPDAVLIMGGANDLLQGAAIAHPLENIAALIALTRKRDLLALVGLPAPFSPDDPGLLGIAWPRLDRAAEALRQEYVHGLRALCAKEVCQGIDFDAELPSRLKERGLALPSIYLDGVHLTAAGHRLCADIVLGALTTLAD